VSDLRELYKTHLYQIASGGICKIFEDDGLCHRIRFSFDLFHWKEIDLVDNEKKPLAQLLPLVPVQLAAKAWSCHPQDFAVIRIDSFKNYLLAVGRKRQTNDVFVSVGCLNEKEYLIYKSTGYLTLETLEQYLNKNPNYVSTEGVAELKRLWEEEKKYNIRY